MHDQPQRKPGFKDNLGMLPQVPLLYLQFIRYQPSIVGRMIALIPVALLILAVVLLVL